MDPNESYSIHIVQIQYLVRWVNYGPEADEWVDINKLDCAHKIAQFNAEKVAALQATVRKLCVDVKNDNEDIDKVFRVVNKNSNVLAGAMEEMHEQRVRLESVAKTAMKKKPIKKTRRRNLSSQRSLLNAKYAEIF